MKHYPSIAHWSPKLLDGNVHVFDKLDGSNIRAEWSSKRKGFYKFGTRQQLLDPNDAVLGPAIGLIRDRYESDLTTVLRPMGYESVVCFFEFFGPSSFAGQHVQDEDHEVVLFDIAPYRRGILPPDEFIDLCGHLRIPRVLHVGRLDGPMLVSIRDGTLPGMTFEGVVCKRATHDGRQVEMFKLKSAAWLARLKEHCAGDERMFKELA